MSAHLLAFCTAEQLLRLLMVGKKLLVTFCEVHSSVSINKVLLEHGRGGWKLAEQVCVLWPYRNTCSSPALS
jgi:hypothetical protein